MNEAYEQNPKQETEQESKLNHEQEFKLNPEQGTMPSDWTRSRFSSPEAMLKFVDKLQAMKAGKPVDWTCPFCGGKVGRMSQVDGHTVIGCDSCDMRINLETR